MVTQSTACTCADDSNRACSGAKAVRHSPWLRSMPMEIAAKPSVKSRGKTNPRGVKRKMSNFNLRCRGQPLHQIASTVVEVIGC